MKKVLLCIFSICLVLVLASCAEVDPCEDGHTITTRTVEPTCSYDGALVEYCGVCYLEFSRTPIEKLAHTPAEEWQITVAPTCSSNGMQEKQCAVCSTVLDTLTLDMLPHMPGDWELITEHTCTSDGTKVQYCMECGEIAGTETIPADHDVIELDAVAPSCANTGLTKGSKCSVCDEVFVSQVEIEKLDHSYQKVDAVEPTCSAYGYMEGSQCTACGTWEFDRVRIDKLSHTVEEDPAREPTCTQSGLLEGSHCAVCKETIVSQKTISAYGHDFNIFDNTCERCFEKEYVEITNLNEEEQYDGEEGIVFLLDAYIAVGDYNTYYYTVKPSTNYIRFVGTTERMFNLYINVEARETPVTIDFVNASLYAKNPIVSSPSPERVNIGFYGELCVLVCEAANNGGAGKNGTNGSSAIDVAGPLNVVVEADCCEILGGSGGNGGKGNDSWASNGDNGGNGGDGGYGISAEAIYMKFGEGYTKDNVYIDGGIGGTGGKGGKAYSMIGIGSSLLYDDGKPGKPGKDQDPTNVEIIYQ